MIRKFTICCLIPFAFLICILAFSKPCLAQCSVFADDFESGTLQSAWVSGTNAHTTNISSSSSPQGIYHLEYTNTINGVYNEGRKATFTPSQITQCSWKMKSTNFSTTPTGNVFIGDANLATNYGIIQCFFFNNNITFVGNGSVVYNYPATPNTWYDIQIKNINWTAKSYDVYINNVLVQLAFPFRNLSSIDVNQISLYNFSTGTVSYDDIKLDTAAGGLTLTCLASLSANSCLPINYTLPLATRDCVPVTPILVSGLGSGSVFPIGTTTEEYKIFDTTVNVRFYESFANNSNGWTLGTEWQIGSATISTGHVAGGPDPGSDHTPTADNGVAGVVIGGNATNTVHPTYYITSPIINTASSTGKLDLEYYRWLNSDFIPYMQNFIEVFDGTTWQVVWQTGGFPNVTDNSWVKQNFDITAYKNSAMQIRFGHNVGAPLAQTSSSWNIDDVLITESIIDSASCSFNIIVTDNIPPVPDMPSLLLAVLCEGDTLKNIPTATDACTGQVMGITASTLVYPNQGSYTITWQYDDGNGNISNQIQNVTVFAKPNILATPDSTIICLGESVTLFGSGGQPNSYTWTGGISDNVPFNPTVSANYIVTGSNALASCTATDTAYVEVKTSIASSPSGTGAFPSSICAGNYSMLTANAFSPLDTILWYTQPTGGTPFAQKVSGDSILVSPTVNTTYYAEINVNSSSQIFNFTGAVDSFIVPAGVTSLDFIVEGAQGNSNAMGVPGGLGGRSTGSLAVSSGQKLYINVGGGGQIDTLGGYNGGGLGGTSPCLLACGGGGGGASDIRVGGNNLFFRTIVAAGGGGAAGDRRVGCGRGSGGGGGGGYYGGGGGAAWPNQSTILPTGGTQMSGGTGGTSSFTLPNNNGSVGLLGTGGAAGNEINHNQSGNATASSGGSGGGLQGSPGLHPGPGNANFFTGQSGAGGSGFISPSISNGLTTAGLRTGNGRVVISWQAPCPSNRVAVPVTVGTPSTTISNATSNNTSSTTGTGFSTQFIQSAFISRDFYNTSCEPIATIANNSGPLGNTVTQVTVLSTVPTHNTQPYVARWFQITPNDTSAAASINLYFTQDDFDKYNAYAGINGWPLLPTGPSDASGISNVRITKNSNAGLGNNPIVLNPFSVSWNGIDNYWTVAFNTIGFSQFRVHAANPGNVALPVGLEKFTVEKLGHSDLAKWTTLNEFNNSHFNIERSADGIDFESIGRVNSKSVNGTSLRELSYSFIDEKPLVGNNYYRLEQVDIDNNSTFSKVINIVWDEIGNTIVLYPNPTKDVINVELSIQSRENITVQILDMSGRVVKSTNQYSVSGTNTVQISMKDLSVGLYGIQVYLNNKLQLVEKIRKED